MARKFTEIYESIVTEDFELVMEGLNEAQFAFGTDMQELYKLRAQMNQPNADREELSQKIEVILARMPDQEAANKIRASLNKGISYMGVSKPKPQ